MVEPVLINAVIPFQIAKALEGIHKIDSKVSYLLTRKDIRTVQDATRLDIDSLKQLVGELELPFEVEKDRLNGNDSNLPDGQAPRLG